MATLPQIAKSASLKEKALFLNKHYQSVPMLKAFVGQGIISIDALDDAAMDAVLGSNGMLSLTEVSKDDVIIQSVAAKSDQMLRISKEVTEGLAEQGMQSTEGLVKLNFACVFLLHRSVDTEALTEELLQIVKDKANVDLL